MAYLPFYLTPEEFEEHQTKQELAIREGKNLHTWTCNNIEEANRYAAIQFTCLALTPAAIIMALIGRGGEHWAAYLAAFLIFVVIAYAGYLTAGLDNRYTYALSELGLVQKKRRDEPEWVNTAMQAIAGLCAFW
ncbi:hypothetical protein [Vibrio mexicanus]|uniref:hypothetical protein n=1 Tax=Vibrio mexicanus TaxID=1004326 RepID=UPI00069A88A5|nr:hypothetical protein [Vibrio mexicanus]